MKVGNTMKHGTTRMMAAGILLAGTTMAFCEDAPLSAPPQEQGLRYTRSARPAAREAIGGNRVFHPCSRYAYVAGYRTRLDAGDLLHGEALPEITDDKATATARVRWADQVDKWTFDTSLAGVGAQLKEAKNSADPA